MSAQAPQRSARTDGRLLSAGDVASLLGVPKSWVYAETRAGRLPHVVLGRYRRYRRDAIDAWLAEHERGPVANGQNAGGGSERITGYGESDDERR